MKIKLVENKLDAARASSIHQQTFYCLLSAFLCREEAENIIWCQSCTSLTYTTTTTTTSSSSTAINKIIIVICYSRSLLWIITIYTIFHNYNYLLLWQCNPECGTVFTRRGNTTASPIGQVFAHLRSAPPTRPAQQSASSWLNQGRPLSNLGLRCPL